MGVTEEVPIPGSLKEAFSCPQAPYWRVAVGDELGAHKGFGTWDEEPVDLPAGMHAIDTKWLFGLKRDSEGRIVRFKARLVARGFTQVHGLDFDETHSSVARWGTIRSLLALSAVHGWAVQVADVNNAFLNAPLAEEVYIKIPEGVEGPRGKVLRLRMALYGLKQAPRSWERELGQFLERLGFSKSLTDNALYYRYSKDGTFTFVPVYVDDLMVVAKNNQTIQAFLGDLRSGYKIKELGNISVYLGVQVERDMAAKTVALGLHKYITGLEGKFRDLLQTTGGGSRGTWSPMTPEAMKKLKEPDCWTEEEAKPVDRTAFMSVLGSLMFAALTCRPDLSFSVSLLSQAGADPRLVHMEAITRALRYLVCTKKTQLVYQGKTGTAQPCIFTDSDWGSERDGQSRAAWVAKVAGAPVTWYSKKLNLVALSSTEAEYKALAEGAKEAMWLKNMYSELQLPLKCVTLYCDNQAAIQVSKNPVQHFKTRHFRLAWHFIRELQAAGEVAVEFVRTALQDADMLTKALAVNQHMAAAARLGLDLK